MGRFPIARFAALALLVASPLLFSGCDYFSSPQNTFNPAGTVAQQQKDDFLLVMWPSLVVGLIVLFGVLFIGVLANGLVQVNVSPYFERVAIGIALVLAAGLDILYQRLDRLKVPVEADRLTADTVAPAGDAK